MIIIIMVIVMIKTMKTTAMSVVIGALGQVQRQDNI